MSSATEVAWAAGLFEGEGSFTTAHDPRREGKRYLRVCLQTTDRDVLERFARIVGCGSIYTVRPDPRNPGGKQVWSWSVQTEAAFRRIFEMFEGHLGARRRVRAQELLRLHGRINPGQGRLACGS